MPGVGWRYETLQSWMQFFCATLWPMIRRNTVDVDEIFANDDSGDPDALLDMINRNPVQIKSPPAAEIAP